MTSFYIFLATSCFFGHPYGHPGFDQGHCVQTARISTSPVAQYGETAYRAVLASATVCDLSGHDWGWIFVNPPHGTKFYRDLQQCTQCGRKRRKITTEKWEEITP